MLLLPFWGLVLGCQDVQEKVTAEQWSALTRQLERLEQRLVALEIKPQLQFELRDLDISLKERMLQPRLQAKALLAVSGQAVPDSFYVDMLMQVSMDGEESQSAPLRQVFSVIDGQAMIELSYPLPRHGLSLDQINLQLRPLIWYRGEVIPEERILYVAQQLPMLDQDDPQAAD